MAKVELYTTKEEVIERIGEWPTVQIGVGYEKCSDEVVLKYRGETVKYKGDAGTAAYLAWQCHGINGREYDEICKKVK